MRGYRWRKRFPGGEGKPGERVTPRSSKKKGPYEIENKVSAMKEATTKMGVTRKIEPSRTKRQEMKTLRGSGGTAPGRSKSLYNQPGDGEGKSMGAKKRGCA